jgi:hypothetical protein
MEGAFTDVACVCTGIEYSAAKELYTSQIFTIFDALTTDSFRVVIPAAQFVTVQTCGCSAAKGYLWDEATNTCIKKVQNCHVQCLTKSTEASDEDCICYECNTLYGLSNGGRNNDCVLLPVDETYPHTDVANVIFTEVNAKVYAGK